MNDTITRDDTKSRLDELAAAPPPQSRGELVPAVSYLPPAERHGAIKVEVARSLPEVRASISDLAQLLGERGFYRWPVRNKKKNTVDWVEGVSIKGAMALIKAYGNCRVSCPMVVDLGTHWRFHAVFVDFQTGTEVERSFLQRKAIAGMGDDAARKEDMAYQNGVSKAERNVILNALEIEADILLEECRRSIIGKVDGDPDFYRGKIVDRAKERGIELARIEAVVGRAAKDWLAPDLVRIIGMMQAINDGMTSAEEAFPKIGIDEEPTTSRVNERLDRMADERHMVNPQDAAEGPSPGGQAAASPSEPPRPEEAAAADDPADQSALQEEMISRLMRMAQDKQLTVNERLENLEQLTIGLHDMLPRHPEFVDTAINTAAKVAKGELLSVTAAKYLRELVTP